MNSPKRSHPKKKTSCQKRHMRWVAKSKEHKGYCRPKHNKSPMTRKGRSNAKYYGAWPYNDVPTSQDSMYDYISQPNNKPMY